MHLTFKQAVPERIAWNRRSAANIAAGIVVGLFCLHSPAMSQASANYESRITLAAATTKAFSSRFDTYVIAGQQSPGGAASECNMGFVNSLGFWSSFGDLKVPIELMVFKNPSDPTVFELSWSGSDAHFEVYRAFNPQNVVDPGHLEVITSACSAIDYGGSESDIIFYKVIAQSEE